MSVEDPSVTQRLGVVSRRGFIQTAARASAGLLVAACVPGSSPDSTVTSMASSTVGSTTPIGSTTSTASSEPAIIRWIDAMAGPAQYHERVFAEFMELHPNVTIEYTLVPVAELASSLQAFLQSDTPPDIFVAPSFPAAMQMINQGIAQPLDPYVDPEWKDTFPQGTFIEGGLMFGGEIYSFPHSGARQSEGIFWYNADVFQQAGLDPDQPPSTWEDLRSFSQRIVDASNGQAFGLILQGGLPNSVGHVATVLATSSGEAFGPIGGGRNTIGGINWHTGEYAFASDRYMEAIEFLRSLEVDGLLFPGWTSLSPQDSLQRLAQGNAAMFSWGSYVVGQLANTGDYPDFPLRFAPPPTATEQRFHLNRDQALPALLLHADSKHPDIAGELLMFRSSPAYFKGYVEEVQVQPAPLPEVNQNATVSDEFRAATDFFDEWVRFQPLPFAKNPGQSGVFLEMKPVVPDFGEIITAAIAGEVSDPGGALRELDEKLTVERSRAIDAVNAAGGSVSEADWLFPNWDPATDYDEAFYQDLAG